MTTIATLAVKLIADAAGFIGVMDQAEKKTQTWSSNVSQNLKNVGGDITNLGSRASTYLTLPLLAAGTAAVNYASDLEETKSKASVIFGEMAEDLFKWSNTSATTFGQSQKQALDGASNFAIFGRAANLSNDDLLNFAKTNTELASDLASFFNTSPEEAITALGAAYRGESEPIRKYGVLLNEAALQQQALTMGLISEIGPLTQQQRIMAAYELIMKQTAVAQGDFARTAEGVANQTRIARAQFEDAAAALGVQLLPYALQLIQWISKAITWFEALTPQQQKWVIGFLAIAAAVGPLLVVIGSLITAVGAIVGVIGAITTPVLIVIGVIAALIAIGVLLYQAWQNNWLGIRQVVDWVLTYIKTIVAAWQAAFSGDWYRFGQLLRQAWDMLWKVIAGAVSNAGSAIKAALSTAMTNAMTALKNFNWADAGKNIVLGIRNGILGNVRFAVNAVIAMGEAVMAAIKGFFGIASPAKLLQKEVAPWLVKGAFDWTPFVNRSLFQPAFARVPGITAGLMRESTAKSAEGINLLNYGVIMMPEGGDVSNSLLRQLG
jgi:hypothetical protein